jgi:hypothetical protein
MKIMGINQFPTREMRRRVGRGSVNIGCAVTSKPGPDTARSAVHLHDRRTAIDHIPWPAELQRFVADG